MSCLAFCRSSGLLLAILLLAILLVVPLAGCQSAPEGKAAASMTRLATQLRAQGDPRAAVAFYQRALERNPDHAEARKGLAATLEKLGDREGALAHYREGAARHLDDVEIQRGLGRLLLAQDRPAEARKAFEAALDRDSDDTRAANGLAVTLDQTGDHEGAQKLYRAALKRNPGNLATLNNLAYSLILDDQPEEAIALLEPHLKDPKATAALRQNLALAYGLAGMDADAERVARMDLPLARVKEHLAYYRQQRAERAIADAPFAEMGSYPTAGLASSQLEKIRPHIPRTGSGLKPVVVPQVTAPGGTPRFQLRLLGCAGREEVASLCARLAGTGLPCRAR